MDQKTDEEMRSDVEMRIAAGMKTNEAREVCPDMKVKKQMPTNARTSSLQSSVFLLLIAATTVSAVPASDPRTVLYDFERGAVDWKGNPWGTGKAHAETAAGVRFDDRCVFPLLVSCESGIIKLTQVDINIYQEGKSLHNRCVISININGFLRR